MRRRCCCRNSAKSAWAIKFSILVCSIALYRIGRGLAADWPRIDRGLLRGRCRRNRWQGKENRGKRGGHDCWVNRLSVHQCGVERYRAQYTCISGRCHLIVPSKLIVSILFIETSWNLDRLGYQLNDNPKDAVHMKGQIRQTGRSHRQARRQRWTLSACATQRLQAVALQVARPWHRGTASARRLSRDWPCESTRTAFR